MAAVDFWIGLLTGFTLGTIGYVVSPAKAHDFYPIECCHQIDCAPVDHVEIMDTRDFVKAGMGFVLKLKLPSQTILHTKHGTATVPEDFDPRSIYDSPDGQMHACIRSGKLVCWFKPASG